MSYAEVKLTKINSVTVTTSFPQLNTIAEDSLYLCARLPYSAEHHRDYVEMRTTLQIIAICSRNVVSFGCAGISDISVAVFAEMVNNCYSMFTFLRDFVEDRT